MAENVQLILERMAPSLREMQAEGVFEEAEVGQVIARRTDFEYQLNSARPRKVDYLRAIKFELDFEALRKARKAERGIRRHLTSDESVVKRVHFVFERALRKFRGDVALWRQWIAFCQRTHAHRRLSTIFGRVLQLLPKVPSLWLQAAEWEFDSRNNTAAARTLLQRAIRVNAGSRDLWLALFRLEVLFALRMRTRRMILRLDSVPIDDDFAVVDESGAGAAAATVEDAVAAGLSDAADDADGPQDPVVASRRALLNGSAARIVYDGFVEACPQDFEGRLAFLSLLDALDRRLARTQPVSELLRLAEGTGGTESGDAGEEEKEEEAEEASAVGSALLRVGEPPRSSEGVQKFLAQSQEQRRMLEAAELSGRMLLNGSGKALPALGSMVVKSVLRDFASDARAWSLLADRVVAGADALVGDVIHAALVAEGLATGEAESDNESATGADDDEAQENEEGDDDEDNEDDDDDLAGMLVMDRSGAGSGNQSGEGGEAVVSARVVGNALTEGTFFGGSLFGVDPLPLATAEAAASESRSTAAVDIVGALARAALGDSPGSIRSLWLAVHRHPRDAAVWAAYIRARREAGAISAVGAAGTEGGIPAKPVSMEAGGTLMPALPSLPPAARSALELGLRAVRALESAPLWDEWVRAEAAAIGEALAREAGAGRVLDGLAQLLRSAASLAPSALQSAIRVRCLRLAVQLCGLEAARQLYPAVLAGSTCPAMPAVAVAVLEVSLLAERANGWPGAASVASGGSPHASLPLTIGKQLAALATPGSSATLDGEGCWGAPIAAQLARQAAGAKLAPLSAPLLTERGVDEAAANVRALAEASDGAAACSSLEAASASLGAAAGSQLSEEQRRAVEAAQEAGRAGVVAALLGLSTADALGSSGHGTAGARTYQQRQRAGSVDAAMDSPVLQLARTLPLAGDLGDMDPAGLLVCRALERAIRSVGGGDGSLAADAADQDVDEAGLWVGYSMLLRCFGLHRAVAAVHERAVRSLPDGIRAQFVEQVARQGTAVA